MKENKYGYNFRDMLYDGLIEKEYYGHDPLGSVMLLSDEKGDQQQSYKYDAFGRMTEGHSAEGNDLGYNGKKIEPATGWVNYGFRDYTPELARFTTIDPIKDSLNWFTYVGNEPVNRIDRWGLEISVQVHEVAFGNDHSSIIIILENQDKHKDNKLFDNTFKDENGKIKRCATLGADPLPKYGPNAKLVSRFNRGKDKNCSTKIEVKPVDLKGHNEDAVIKELFENDANYGDDLDYDIFPQNEEERKLLVPDDGYNSNSYTAGLLQATGYRFGYT